MLQDDVTRALGRATKPKSAHPGFKKVAAKIGREPGIKNPAAVLAASTRRAGVAARKKNPRLNRVR